MGWIVWRERHGEARRYWVKGRGIAYWGPYRDQAWGYRTEAAAKGVMTRLTREGYVGLGDLRGVTWVGS